MILSNSNVCLIYQVILKIALSTGKIQKTKIEFNELSVYQQHIYYDTYTNVNVTYSITSECNKTRH